MTEPDPSWDYYILHARLQKVRHSIDHTLIIISRWENQDSEVDEEIKGVLNNAIAILQELAQGKF